MNKEQEALIYNQIIAKNKHIEALNADQNFLKWKEETIVPYLESMRQSILGIDRTQEGWKERATDAITAYQETHKLFEGLFVLSLNASVASRRGLTKLSE